MRSIQAATSEERHPRDPVDRTGSPADLSRRLEARLLHFEIPPDIGIPSDTETTPSP